MYTQEYVNDFLEDLDILCKNYDISISHEDPHGSFILKYYNEDDAKWIKDAYFADAIKENDGLPQGSN